MANKLSNTQVPDNVVGADDKGTPDQVVPVKTRDAGAAARNRPEPTERKKKASRRSEPAARSATLKITKAELILKKLRTAKGASIEMLIAETGWQAHSVRGFLSAVVRKKLALNLLSESGKDGVRRYRIDSDAKLA